MTLINVKRLINNINKTNIYTPIIEAVVNSIDAIEDTGKKDGEIIITLIRENKIPNAIDKNNEESIPQVISIKIQDNGIGFNNSNLEAFNTIYTEQKLSRGGKGFGRFVFLKYFNNVKINSVYFENNNYLERTFEFINNDDIIQNKLDKKTNKKNNQTKILLDTFQKSHLNKLDKKIETIARKLLEKLLVYFTLDNYNCPKIIIKESEDDKSITLNDFFGNKKGIEELNKKKFSLETTDKKHKTEFIAKVFKVLYGESQSSINLVAHNRLVTETVLYEYIPEFKDDFYDKIKNEKGDEINKNYTIKVYVTGKYLDENVSVNRESFEFSKNNDMFHDFSQQEIEKKSAEIAKETFTTEILTRREKKEKVIKDYVNSEAPWYKPYVSKLDFTNISYDATTNTDIIESELHRVKYIEEKSTKIKIKQLLKNNDNNSKDLKDRIEDLVGKITEIGKSDLTHYVSNRKIVLDIFRKLLERTDDGSASYEKEIHNIIFPMGKNSSNINYEDHNLWLLDERLVFSEYIGSDKKISKSKDSNEPDLVIFDNKTSFRGGDNEFSNPLTIFEFKRPKRTEYTDEEDPIDQIGKYLEEIRQGKYETPKGIEKIKVNESTPVYGFIVCDLTEKIRQFAGTRHQLIISPDNEGYFGYHNGYKMYIEIITFKKLLKDANLRNKIFFKKLNIE